MIIRTFIKNVHFTVNSSTHVETFSYQPEEKQLRVYKNSADEMPKQIISALGKTPEGGVVEIDFTSSSGRTSSPIRISYYI